MEPILLVDMDLEVGSGCGNLNRGKFKVGYIGTSVVLGDDRKNNFNINYKGYKGYDIKKNLGALYYLIKNEML